MIHHLEISNFKSVKKLKLNCKKVNVFIGEPNSGKSNIVEAMALQCVDMVTSGLDRGVFRFRRISDLYTDFNIEEPIIVKADESTATLSYPLNGNVRNNVGFYNYRFWYNENSEDSHSILLNHSGEVAQSGRLHASNVMYYNFKRLTFADGNRLSNLDCPHGVNLSALLVSHKSLRLWVADFLAKSKLLLNLKPDDGSIEVGKWVDGTIYSYPYSSISETLQRVIFYEMAIASNKASVLLFDEPETHTFPFYTKYLAERIALDEWNQFFLTTHNPYLLLSLIEKTPFDNLNVILCQMKDYQTEATVLNKEQVEQVLDLNSDVFFNFDQLLGK
ncbi:MAG: AAA family ATPase [Flavobacteriales bacterium]